MLWAPTHPTTTCRLPAGRTGSLRISVGLAINAALLVRRATGIIFVLHVFRAVALDGLRLLGFRRIGFSPMPGDIAAHLFRNPNHQFPIPAYRRGVVILQGE